MGRILRWAALATAPVVVALAGASPAGAADPVVAAAGDIACDPSGTSFNGGLGEASKCRQKYTSDILMTDGIAAVLPLGDTQYEHGSLAQFQQSYDLSWGRLKAKTRPAIGNHEYFAGSGTPTGSGYFDYFNGPGNPTGPAGDRDKGYYSFDVGEWHLIALNSVCQEVGGCAAGSPQEQWLRADLAAHQNACTLAYWHHPRFNSGPEGNYTATADLWRTLHEGGAELVLTGHAHSYERFAPQDANGNADPTYGIRQIVVGTGGKSLGTTWGAIHPNSEVRENRYYGVVKLTLHPSSYDWSFARESGAVADAGSGTCHGAPPGGPPDAQTGEATSVGTTSARLNAAVNPQSRPTTYRFEYGPTERYGSTTTAQPVSPVSSAHRQVAAELSGLVPGATYHYRVVAQSAAGTSTGADRTFRLGTYAGRYAEMIDATPGLRSHWRLGEASGSFAWDRKGLELGTYRGSPALGQAGALADDPDLAAGFDGVDDEMSATGPVISVSGTLEGWFRWQAGKALLRDDSWASGWVLAYANSSGNLGYRIGGTIFSTGRKVDVTARDGRWHHIAVTKNGPDVAYYLDGALLHDPVGEAANRPASGPWHVMKNGQHTEFAQGQADDVAIYDVALSGAAIRQHYEAGLPDTVAPDTAIDSGPSGASRDTTAEFAFSSSERGSTFRCRLDGPAGPGSEAACDSPKTYTGLSDGAYTLRVHSVDQAGNPDASPATRSFIVDTTPPETAIDSGPSGATTATDASFSFSSSEPGSAFRCRLDAGAWSACTSPKSYSGLAAGSHTFEVQATDAVGNQAPTPATRSFSVEPESTPADATPPGTEITAGPQGLRSDSTTSFSFSSSEPGSTFECRLDGPGTAIGAEEACTSPKSYGAVADGAYTFRVYAVDAAGNGDPTPATRSFEVDTTNPQTTIDSGPSGVTNAPDASFRFSSNEQAATFQCRLDMQAWSACTSPRDYTGLSLGAHVFEVRAVDPAANVDPSPATRSFTVEPEAAPAADTSPPDTTIESGPSGTVDATDARFSFSASESDAAFQCRVDGADWGGCSSPAEYSGLGNGEHAFEVRAIDPAGNVDPSPAARTWTVDRPPAESTEPPPPTVDTPPEPEPERQSTEPASRDHYRPRAYSLASGTVVRRRGAVGRLHRDEGRRLEIAAARMRSGARVVELAVTTSIGDAAASPLERLTLRYNGGVSIRGAAVTARVYNFRTRRWIKVRGPVRGRVSDRDVRWSVAERAFDYVSARGAVRLKVTARAMRAFRVRADLVRVTVER